MIQFRNEHVTVFQSALFQTNSTVVETKDMVLVVDPTWLPHEVEEIRAYVERVRSGRLVYVLYTHADFDHILGSGAFKDAKMIGSAAMAKLEDKQRRVEQILQFDADFYAARPYPVAFPTLHHEIENDGESIQVGNTRLTFFLTPGHTHDGLACLVEPLGLLIAGDYLSNVEFPFIEDSEAYEQTMQAFDHILSDNTIRLLVPGHGTVTDCQHEIRKRIRQSSSYIERLRTEVKCEKNELAAEIKKSYRYYRGLLKEHESNKQVIRKELGLETT
ncbi:MBL fold metallo-hydrolase [Bacillus tianshenii]|nr:MBL fold metallo-hydrolase [Bacillus tianshenii]